MVYYDAQSINPFNNHPARHFKHKVEDCPLLSNWQGKVGSTKTNPKPRCPFCSNKKVLTKARRAERLWILVEPIFYMNFLDTYLETTKSKGTLEKEMENF